MSRVVAVLVFSLAMGRLANARDSWSGTWRYSRGKIALGELRTIDRGGSVKFQLRLWDPPSEHSGEMEGQLTLHEGAATYKTTEFDGECQIEFAFTPKKVTLRQTIGGSNQCGFGVDIAADGTFARVSRKIPMFVED